MEPKDLEKLRLGHQNRCTPRVRGVQFTFRPLTIAEVENVTSEVLARLELLKPHERHNIKEQAIHARITLEKASSLDPNLWNPQVLESTFELLTPDELGYLFSEYTAMVAKCNPKLDDVPVEELAAAAEDLKKNPQGVIELSFLEAIALVRYLLPLTSPTAK